MDKRRHLSGLLLLLSVMLGICTLVLCFFAAGREPVLVKSPPEAEMLLEQLETGIRQGDFEGLQSILAGSPDLGPGREPDTAVGRLLLQHYRQSVTLQKQGQCYALDGGIALNAKASWLDADSVLEPMQKEVSKLLKKRIREAKDPKELYDEENEYREDLIDEILGEAGWQCLREYGRTREKDMVIRFRFEKDGWRILPDEDLLLMIAGNPEP